MRSFVLSSLLAFGGCTPSGGDPAETRAPIVAEEGDSATKRVSCQEETFDRDPICAAKFNPHEIGIRLEEKTDNAHGLELLASSKYLALRGEFQKEYEKQKKKVLEAGGYCGLTESYLEADDPRLGDRLQELVEERNVLLGEFAQARWEVHLGAAQCSMAGFSEGADPKPFIALAEEWNRRCGYLQGGWMEAGGDRPVEQILVERGRLTQAVISDEAEVQMGWRSVCTPDVDSGAPVLEGPELLAYQASEYLYNKALVGPAWSCPVKKGFWTPTAGPRHAQEAWCGFYPQAAFQGL